MSVEKIKDVKMMLLFSGLKQREIAAYHSVPQSRVSEIKNGDIYSHIDVD